MKTYAAIVGGIMAVVLLFVVCMVVATNAGTPATCNSSIGTPRFSTMQCDR